MVYHEKYTTTHLYMHSFVNDYLMEKSEKQILINKEKGT